MEAKPQPCYNRICAMNDSVITRLQCIYQNRQILSEKFQTIIDVESFNVELRLQNGVCGEHLWALCCMLYGEHLWALIIIIIIMNFYSPVSNTRCHSIGHKMRIARIKIRVDSPGRWERA